MTGLSIAFYAPMKAPTHPVPSGDRRMARLLWQALEHAGHRPYLASAFRSYEGAGDPSRQAEIARAASEEATRLLDAVDTGAPPDAWFTYHLYHKAPDWLGPPVCAAHGVPYLVCEASMARKQARGPYARWLELSAQAIARADVVLSVTPEDEEGILPLVADRRRLRRLRPFVDCAAYRTVDRARSRRDLANQLSLDPGRPWLLTVAMMRPGDKLASYRILGRTLGMIADPPWQLLVVGDGTARPYVEEALSAIGAPHVVYAGARSEAALPAIYAACDLFVWPAYNEAYGLAMLEAQAAGLPVVAGRWRGVPEVVADGETGVLVEPRDEIGFAEAVVALTTDTARREALGDAAARRVEARHSVAAAAAVLDDAFHFALGAAR